MTINEAMALQRAVRSRMVELVRLRDSVAVERTTTYFGDRDKKEEVVAKFDVKTVDKKITQLELFLFKADGAIKQANAKTELNITADVDNLLAPLE